jgi:transcriptional regulator GlxA family with amidase domain
MNVAILLYHEVNELEAVTLFHILHSAKQFLKDPDELNVFTLAKARNSVQTSGGLTITPLYAFMSCPQPEVIIVPGGSGIDKAIRDKTITAYLGDVRPQLKILASVASGALLLGKLGFLRDQIATTTPELLEALEEFEVLNVSTERVVKNDSGIWCAGPSMAAVDLAMDVVRHVTSQDVAQRIEKRLGLVTSQPGLF